MIGDEGFFMVPEIIKQIKSAINIDDDREIIIAFIESSIGQTSAYPTIFAVADPKIIPRRPPLRHIIIAS